MLAGEKPELEVASTSAAGTTQWDYSSTIPRISEGAQAAIDAITDVEIRKQQS